MIGQRSQPASASDTQTIPLGFCFLQYLGSIGPDKYTREGSSPTATHREKKAKLSNNNDCLSPNPALLYPLKAKNFNFTIDFLFSYFLFFKSF